MLRVTTGERYNPDELNSGCAGSLSVLPYDIDSNHTSSDSSTDQAKPSGESGDDDDSRP